MNRQEKFDSIIARMKLPANSDRLNHVKNASNLDKEDTLIRMHLKHIRDYLHFLSLDDPQNTDDIYRKFIETSCDSAIHSLEKLLGAKGWA